MDGPKLSTTLPWIAVTKMRKPLNTHYCNHVFAAWHRSRHIHNSACFPFSHLSKILTYPTASSQSLIKHHPHAPQSFYKSLTSTTMPNRFTQRRKAAKGVSPPAPNTTQQPAANANSRVRWAEPVASIMEFPNHAVSDPIWIPGCEPIEQRSPDRRYHRDDMHLVFDTEPRIHHRLDNVSDYGRNHGWEFAQRARVEREEANVGKILAGEWPPRIPWEQPTVIVRKDPDFSKDPKPSQPTQQEKEEEEVRLKMLEYRIAKQLRKLQR